MRTSDEIKACLQHDAFELCQVQELSATISDHVQTATDEIHMGNSHANLIKPTIDVQIRQIHGLSEEIVRVYALRSEESDTHLKDENAELKKDVAALQEALRLETEQHQAHLSDFVRSSEELNQRFQTSERCNTQLRVRLKEMKDQYDDVIIENLDLKDPNKALQSTLPFNDAANTAAFSSANSGTSPGPMPFGKTVVEISRGLTVTIETSRDNSPAKASLNQGWIPEFPSGTAFPFPNIARQPQCTSQIPANGASTQIASRTPGKPTGRAIVRGTKEANESFERMQRNLNSLPLPDLTKSINMDDNNVASSSSASGHNIPIIRPFDVRPVTPGNVRSKLNPAVEAFTPSNSSGRDSAKSHNIQAFSPNKDQFNLSVNATATKEEGFVPPHLRYPSKISVKEKPVATTEELFAKDKVEDQGTIATSAQNASTRRNEPPQAPSLNPRIAPHLRRRTNVVKNEDVNLSQMQGSAKGKNEEEIIEGTELSSRELARTSMKENLEAAITSGPFVRSNSGLQAWLDSQEQGLLHEASSHKPASVTSDECIKIDPNTSAKAGEDKIVPLSPGSIPTSAKDAPTKTETAAPIKTDRAASPTAVHDRITTDNPAVKDEGAPSGQEALTKTKSEKEKNAALVAEYNRRLSSVIENYRRESREDPEAQEDEVGPIKPPRREPVSPPHPKPTSPAHLLTTDDKPPQTYHVRPSPTGTHELGSLLDDECAKMILRPRQAGRAESAGLEWKAARKDGKLAYIL